MLSGAAQLLFFRKRHPASGAMPGTLVPPPDPSPPLIRAIVYGPDHLAEREIGSAEDVTTEVAEGSIAWIDVQGLGDETSLRHLGELFALHPLALEDAVNIPQRPKFEDYEHQQLFITRLARFGPHKELDIEQVSLFLGPRYVLTLQERRGDTFDPVRRRLRAAKGPIRRSGSDYLDYALIDVALDGFYPVVEEVGDRLHELEEQILIRPTNATLHRVHAVRRELLALRRAVWPQREAIAALMHDGNEFVTDEVRNYLRDCHDHAVQIADVIETYREFAGNLMDMYMSSVSLRTNDVMKVLTIMASIFIPLTFIAGIYGMNFEHLPELHVRWGYFVVLGVMASVAIAMLVFFYRRGWIGSRDPGDDGPR